MRRIINEILGQYNSAEDLPFLPSRRVLSSSGVFKEKRLIKALGINYGQAYSLRISLRPSGMFL